MNEGAVRSDARLEWDNPEFQKRDWGEGDWLHEPDKVQFACEGYRGLALRSRHGAWCGYIGILPGHPAYGYSYQGYSQLVADIIQAQSMENMTNWGKKGYPKTEHGFPDVELNPEEPPLTPLGQQILGIRVHGGLTYSGSPSRVDEGTWHYIQEQFDHAEERARQYPIGDAAMWLQKWTPAKNDFEKFKEICRATCICFEPTDDDVWLFGFDCAHAGDKMPAVEATLRFIKPGWEASDYMKEDVCRNLQYVEKECLNLAIQLKAPRGNGGVNGTNRHATRDKAGNSREEAKGSQSSVPASRQGISV